MPAPLRGLHAGPGGPLVVAVFAALLYATGLSRLPHPDELYQILAAQGLAATGEPRIADGLYTRAYAQTWLIAWTLRLLGDTVAAARLSSLLAVAATAGLLFAWLRREAGPTAAWLGATGFALSPFAAETALFARIYGVQAFAFLLASLAVYAALARPAETLRRRLLLLALAVPPLLLAAHLQPTTLLGAAGLGFWAAAAVTLPWLRDPTVPARRKALWLAAAAAALGLGAMAALHASGLLTALWHDYRSAPIFNEARLDEFWYYHAWYSLYYPTFWPLTGVLALAALAARPRPAGLALAVFATGFLLNSFGGPKSLRYIAYAQPFLFALWGIGLAALCRTLRTTAAELAGRLAGTLPLPPGGPWPLRAAQVLLGLALLALLVANPAWLRTATLLADIPLPGEQPGPDWAAARPALEPWLGRAQVVATTEELGTLYFLGRFDVRFSPSKLGEFADDADEAREFALDPRTGRPVIATPESLALLVDCHAEGLFLLGSRQWSRGHLFSEPVRRLIVERMEPVPLPNETRVTAYAWRHPEGVPRPAACASLPPLPGPAAWAPSPRPVPQPRRERRYLRAVGRSAKLPLRARRASAASAWPGAGAPPIRPALRCGGVRRIQGNEGNGRPRMGAPWRQRGGRLA